MAWQCGANLKTSSTASAFCTPEDEISGEHVAENLESGRKTISEDAIPENGKLSTAVEWHIQTVFRPARGDILPPPGLYNRILREVEMPLIALSLSATRGNQIKTAELLGINRNTLRKKIKELDIVVTRQQEDDVNMSQT